MIDTETKNVYPDEQEKLDNEFEIELELTLKLIDLLDRYGYDMEATMEDGLPAVNLVKLTAEYPTGGSKCLCKDC